MNWVVDASVVISRVMGEDRPGWVDDYIDDVPAGRVRLSAPSLIWLEIGNRLVRAGTVGDEFVLEAMLKIEALAIEDVPVERPIRLRALTLARAHGLTMYDATYLAVAEATGCGLLTLDAGLDRAAMSMGLGREDGSTKVSEPPPTYGDRPVDSMSMAVIGATLAEMRKEYSL